MVKLPQRASRGHLQREGEPGNRAFHQKGKAAINRSHSKAAPPRRRAMVGSSARFGPLGAKQANHETHENKLYKHGNRWTANHRQRISTLLSCRSCISWSIVRAQKPVVGESWIRMRSTRLSVTRSPLDEFHPGPMARAVAESQGNRELAHGLYMKFRTEELYRKAEREAAAEAAGIVAIPCPRCGHLDQPLRKPRGNLLLLIVLLLLYIIPGLF